MNPENCLMFVNVLKKIPRFKIDLSEEEIDIIGNEGNVLAIGRSGTGKTTCSVLRILAMEFLFRFKYKKQGNELVGNQKKPERNQSEMLRSVFLSVSPILCKMVNDYYKKLVDSARDYQNPNQALPQIDIDEIPIDDDNEFERIDSDEPVTFPLFTSLKAFIYFIDKSLKKPFFNHSLRVHNIQLGYRGRRDLLKGSLSRTGTRPIVSHSWCC